MIPYLALGILLAFIWIFFISSASCFLCNCSSDSKRDWIGIPFSLGLGSSLILISFLLIILWLDGGGVEGLGLAFAILYGGPIIAIVLTLSSVIISLYVFPKLPPNTKLDNTPGPCIKCGVEIYKREVLCLRCIKIVSEADYEKLKQERNA